MSWCRLCNDRHQGACPRHPFARKTAYCRLCGFTVDPGGCPRHDPQPTDKEHTE